MKKVTAVSLLIAGIIIFAISCSKKDSTSSNNGGGNGGITFSCSGISPKFSADVQPVLNTVCSVNSNCHGTGSTNSGGVLTTYSAVNAKKSNIRAAILAGTMPQSGTISQAQINAVICWIDAGAANN